jgi:hypothetical protein
VVSHRHAARAMGLARAARISFRNASLQDDSEKLRARSAVKFGPKPRSAGNE